MRPTTWSSRRPPPAPPSVARFAISSSPRSPHSTLHISSQTKTRRYAGARSRVQRVNCRVRKRRADIACGAVSVATSRNCDAAPPPLSASCRTDCLPSFVAPVPAAHFRCCVHFLLLSVNTDDNDFGTVKRAAGSGVFASVIRAHCERALRIGSDGKLTKAQATLLQQTSAAMQMARLRVSAPLFNLHHIDDALDSDHRWRHRSPLSLIPQKLATIFVVVCCAFDAALIDDCLIRRCLGGRWRAWCALP